MGVKSQAVSGVKWSGISLGAGVALQFVTLIILARILSPSDFGLMGMVMVVIGFAQAFADMGVSNAIIHRQDTKKDQLSSLYWLNILAGIGVFVLICAAVPLIVKFYNEPRLENMLYLTGIIFLITPIGQQFQILLQKELKFKWLAKIEMASSAANSAVAIVLAFLGFGVFSLIWGQLAGSTGKVIMLFSTGWRHWRPHWHFSFKDLKGYLSFGFYQMGERTINYLNSNIDYLLIGSMFGAKSLGYYSLAYNLVIRPSVMINPVLTKVAFPIFAKIQNESERLRRGYLKIIQLLSTIIFPVMAGFMVVAPAAVPVIFGEQWLPSIILIQILSIVGLLRSLGNPIGSLLLAKGRAGLAFNWNLALTIAQIPGLYLGAVMGGAIGVAIAFSFLMISYSIFNYIILVRKMLGPCLSDYIGSIWPFLWMSGAMAIAVFVVGFLFRTAAKPVILLSQVLGGVAVYMGLMVWKQKMVLDEIRNMAWRGEVAVEEF